MCIKTWNRIPVPLAVILFPFEVKLNSASWIDTMGISITGVWTMGVNTNILLAYDSPWRHTEAPVIIRGWLQCTSSAFLSSGDKRWMHSLRFIRGKPFSCFIVSRGIRLWIWHRCYTTNNSNNNNNLLPLLPDIYCKCMSLVPHRFPHWGRGTGGFCNSKMQGCHS